MEVKQHQAWSLSRCVITYEYQVQVKLEIGERVPIAVRFFISPTLPTNPEELKQRIT